MRKLLFPACALTVLLAACTGSKDDRPLTSPSSGPISTDQAVPAAAPVDELGDLPEGPPTSIAWWQRGRLHAHGRTWRVRAPSNIHQAADTVVIERFDRNRMTLLHWTADRPAPIFTGQLYDVVLAPYGDLAVWMEPVGDDLRRLTAWDVTAGETVAQLDLPVDVICCDRGGDVVLFGIAADHRLMYAVGGQPFAWSPLSLPRSARSAMTPAGPTKTERSPGPPPTPDDRRAPERHLHRTFTSRPRDPDRSRLLGSIHASQRTSPDPRRRGRAGDQPGGHRPAARLGVRRRPGVGRAGRGRAVRGDRAGPGPAGRDAARVRRPRGVPADPGRAAGPGADADRARRRGGHPGRARRRRRRLPHQAVPDAGAGGPGRRPAAPGRARRRAGRPARRPTWATCGSTPAARRVWVADDRGAPDADRVRPAALPGRRARASC